MSKELCKGGCGNLASYKGWCKVNWISGKRFGVGCPIITKKRGKAISVYRIKESELGQNPMQNSDICKKNHSNLRNKRASLSLKKLGKLGLLPQQIESNRLKEKRRKNIIKSVQRLIKEGKHPRQLENPSQKRLRTQKISKSIKKLASQNKLFTQNMTKTQKINLGKKISKKLREGIKTGRIKLSSSWKKVPYKGIILRSCWEKETAKFLDTNKIKWAYESLIIPYFDTQRKFIANTIPDFYLPSTNTIIEVKSNAEFRSQNTKDKIKGIRKKGYEVYLFGKNEIELIKNNQTRLLKYIGVIKDEENKD